MSGFSFRVDNSPFNQQQAEVLNQLLATLSPDQMIWLSGYLAGLRGGIAGAGTPAATVEATVGLEDQAGPTQPAAAIERDVTILFGSQTGNSQRLAGDMKKRLEEKGFAVTLTCMSEFRTNNLKKVKQLLIVVSTYGEGDPPDKAVLFHEFVHGKRARAWKACASPCSRWAISFTINSARPARISTLAWRNLRRTNLPAGGLRRRFRRAGQGLDGRRARRPLRPRASISLWERRRRSGR